MLRMTDAEIETMLQAGLTLNSRRIQSRRGGREYRRDECQYDRYVDDWEREGDD
ncbi:MAG: hypothetical protein IJP86_05330 [Synergistaceae bacterium]|nr:hypothetical protein [Synergistaceae bacterium]